MFNHKPCKEICCFPNSAELTSLPHWHAGYTCQLSSSIFLRVPGFYSLRNRLFSNHTTAWCTTSISPPVPCLLNVTGGGEQGEWHGRTLGRVLTHTGCGFSVVRSSAPLGPCWATGWVWSSVQAGTVVLLLCRGALPQPQGSEQELRELCTCSTFGSFLAGLFQEP